MSIKAAKTDSHNSYDYDYNEIITVLVGENEQQFIVHKNTICDKSKFFEAACSSGRWKEGKEKLVRLPEVDPEAFRVYVHWVYTGKVSPEVEWGHADLNCAEKQVTYTEAYIIGDVLDDNDLRKHVIDTMIEKTSAWADLLPCTSLRRIWEATPTASPLRILALEWAVFEGNPQDLNDSIEHFPEEYVRDLAMLMLPRLQDKDECTQKEFKAKLHQQLRSD